MLLSHLPILPAALLAATTAAAAPVTYRIDPARTSPSIEAEYVGIAASRGKFKKTSGKVVLDKAAGTGTVEMLVDAASIDFGYEQINRIARAPELLDTARYPQAIFKGKLEAFVQGAPTRVAGYLTLHGVTKPVVLKISTFKCTPQPSPKREMCGADAAANLKRDDFGINAGKGYGMKMDVTLRIQVEAVKAD
jgi:polyisoprenoid-binding protein YceI